MSDILTRIFVPQQTICSGLQDWGRKTAPEMIEQIRKYAAHLREQAESIEATADHEFQIDIVRGVHVQHLVKELQRSSRRAAAPSQGGEA